MDHPRGLVFLVPVKLTRGALTVDGHPTPPSPGMAATAEVVTGQRRVIDYRWSPVAKAMR